MHGIVLLNELFEPMNLTQVQLAQYLKISVQRINEIVRGKRGITPETAWLFSNAFKNSPEFWINLQNQFDLASSKPKKPVPLLAAG